MKTLGSVKSTLRPPVSLPRVSRRACRFTSAHMATDGLSSPLEIVGVRTAPGKTCNSAITKGVPTSSGIVTLFAEGASSATNLSPTENQRALNIQGHRYPVPSAHLGRLRRPSQDGETSQF